MKKLTKLEKLKMIVKECQAQRVEGQLVDLFSASAIVAVAEKLGPENLEKFMAMPVRKMATVAFKLCS